MSNLEGNEDIIVIIKSETETPIKDKEKNADVEYFLNRKDIRELIKVNWPYLAEKIDKIIIPRISNDPDGLELEESEKRKKRISQLSHQPPLEALQSLLYEELFGVNDDPSQEVSDANQPAPTPGGLISHGYLYGVFNGENIESVSKLPFSGVSVNEAINSLPDFRQKDKFVNILSRITYPMPDFMSEQLRKGLRRAMEKDNYVPSIDVSNWSYRILQLFKSLPELSAPVGDRQLTKIIMPNLRNEISFGQYWYLLWSNMSKKVLQHRDNNVYFNEPSTSEAKEAIHQMLFIRLHPETQFLFKYLSPSGYLNEKN